MTRSLALLVAVTLAAADSLTGPAGTLAPVRDGTVHRFTAPGLYGAFLDGDLVAAYAVNAAAAESDLARAAPGAVAGLFPGREVRTASPGEWDDAIYVERLGREIVWPLVLLALLVLLVESVLAAPGRGATRVRPGNRGAGAPPEAQAPRERSPEAV